MGSLIKFLITYFFKKNIIKISTIENSFFLYKHLDKKIKVTSEIIKINYIKESPYPEETSSISFVLSKENLYLWFVKGNYRYLPEALLLYRHLVLTYSSICCIFKSKIDKVVIIKDGVLVSSFSKSAINKIDLQLIKDEFSIEDVLVIEEKEYATFLKESYAKLKLNDLLSIFNIKIDFKNLWTVTLKYLAIPFFYSSILIVLFMGLYSYYLDREQEKLYKEYQEKRQIGRDFKNSFDKIENENIQFSSLLNELQYHQKTLAISNIIKVTDEMNLSMKYIKVFNDKVEFIIKTDKQSQIPLYVKRLFKSNYFKEVKNISSFKLHDKRIQITMVAQLRKN